MGFWRKNGFPNQKKPLKTLSWLKAFSFWAGTKSGKSRYALKVAESLAGQRIFVATAQAYDDEMRLRILRHQDERGSSWRTVEEPLDLAGVLEREDGQGRVILIDCLTLWLSNLMTQEKLEPDQLVERFDELSEAAAPDAGPR